MEDRNKSKEQLVEELEGLRKNITSCANGKSGLAESEQFLANVFASIQDGISILDTNYTILSVNPAMERWYSHAMPLVGKKCYNVYHGRDKRCDICPTRETLKTKKASLKVVPKIGPDGKVIGWFDLYSFPYLNSKTGKIQGVIEYVRDITARKHAEEMLRKSENKYRMLLEQSSDIIIYFDLKGSILAANHNAADAVDGNSQELVNKTVYDVVDKSIANSVLKRIRGIAKSGLSEEHEDSIDFPMKKGWFRSTYTPMKDIQGAIVGVQIVFHDITGRKKAEQKLEILNKYLVKTNEKLQLLAMRDYHTGLYNYHYLVDIVEAEFHRAKRHATPLSVVMIDIDYFKSINEIYGTKCGDLVLKQLARQLRQLVRKYDIVIRFGGEEFAILCPATDKKEAISLGQRVLDAVSVYNYGENGQAIKLKLSVGVASFPEPKIIKGMDLVDAAGKAMDDVKDYGGNKVYYFTDTKKKASQEEGKTKADVKDLRKRLDRLSKKTNQNLIEAIFAFAKTIELKDHYTGEHVEKTVHYATELAKRLALAPDDIERIKQAAILHDLGKIGISDKILLKKAKLTKTEFEKIKRHPQIAADILRPIQVLHDIIPYIFYHHERWDGSGYPSGLKKEEIPVGARIIALADVYQALSSDRSYRKAFEKSKVLKIIKEGAGNQFDPKIVKVFLGILKEEK